MNRLRAKIVVRKVDNLNKDNFWDYAEQICPLTTKKFREWIDCYKRESFVTPGIVGLPEKWDVIRLGVECRDNNSITVTTVPSSLKFHDLPIEMQIGILYRFFYDTLTNNGKGSIHFRFGAAVFAPFQWIEVVCDMFTVIEELEYDATPEGKLKLEKYKKRKEEQQGRFNQGVDISSFNPGGDAHDM